MDESQQPSRKVKRRLVNNDDPTQEILDTKRLRLELNDDLKRKCIKALAAFYVYLVTKYGLSPQCLHDSAQVSNAVRTCFNTKRQEVNGTGNLKDHQDKPITLNIRGVAFELSRKDLTNDILEVLFARAALSNEEVEHYKVTYVPNTSEVAKRPTKRYDGHDADIAAKKIDDTTTPIWHIKCWDMSGKGAMVIYQTAIAMGNWTMPKTPGFDTTMMSQAVFHSIWGSFS